MKQDVLDTTNALARRDNAVPNAVILVPMISKETIVPRSCSLEQRLSLVLSGVLQIFGRGNPSDASACCLDRA
jgi:hypothetical protein